MVKERIYCQGFGVAPRRKGYVGRSRARVLEVTWEGAGL
jgi:hypothetical protein